MYESLGLGQAARVQYDLLRARVMDEAAAGVDDELVLGAFEADHGDPQAAVRRLRAEWQRQPGIRWRTRWAGRCTGPGTTRRR